MAFNIITGILYALVILSIIFVERKNPQQAITWILIAAVIHYAGLNDVNDLCLQAGLSDVDRRVSAFNNRYNRTPLTTFDRAQFLTSGKAHYEALFNDIKNAHHDIHVEFFTIHDDVVGQEFVDELAKRRRRA